MNFRPLTDPWRYACAAVPLLLIACTAAPDGSSTTEQATTVPTGVPAVVSQIVVDASADMDAESWSVVREGVRAFLNKGPFVDNQWVGLTIFGANGQRSVRPATLAGDAGREHAAHLLSLLGVAPLGGQTDTRAGLGAVYPVLLEVGGVHARRDVVLITNGAPNADPPGFAGYEADALRQLVRDTYDRSNITTHVLTLLPAVDPLTPDAAYLSALADDGASSGWWCDASSTQWTQACFFNIKVTDPFDARVAKLGSSIDAMFYAVN